MPQSVQHIDPEAIMRDVLIHYRTYGDPQEAPKIWSAYEYAKKTHEGIVRKSGDPYIIHPVASVDELMVLQPDSATIMATLLHDTVSHGSGSYSDIAQLF